MTTLSWLAGLWLSAFSSATILPGNSEAVFAAALHFQPQLWLAAWLVVSIGNIMGGAMTAWLGWRVPAPPKQSRLTPYLRHAERLGPISLLLSWVPVVGDALCALAGWLRWPWLAVLIYLSLGKIARYGVMVWLLL
ncbi:DedA family protein [Chitinibacter bivalviorum]|uniref:DedA family protein n=1 Tax=Chitinibacter bivalviorum TaxID=2739434 RepID=A0A7H9BIC0_9NEIS|nr:DedA family protein [Chitinibacter bivalviorum]QLG88375.1 DedA family protein [Chitinibacter bivalviorum]